MKIIADDKVVGETNNIEKETKSAILINGKWIPKSQLKNEKCIVIPKWLWDKKGEKKQDGRT